jgi:hypothetical protein
MRGKGFYPPLRFSAISLLYQGAFEMGGVIPEKGFVLSEGFLFQLQV